MNANIIKKAADIIKTCDEGYVGVIDENGFPNVATRSNIKPHSILNCYFATGTYANLSLRLQKNNKTSVCFHKDGDNVTLVGTSEFITDKKEKNDLWLDWFINHFPEGVDDPNYCIVKFTTHKVSLWVGRTSAEFNISDINNPQSRCGLLCNGCEYKETHGCGSCIKTNGNPFHGQCPIAVCCQNKGYTHCGECDDMPCENLFEYSCGDSEHSDIPKGARIEMLRLWRG